MPDIAVTLQIARMPDFASANSIRLTSPLSHKSVAFHRPFLKPGLVVWLSDGNERIQATLEKLQVDGSESAVWQAKLHWATIQEVTVTP